MLQLWKVGLGWVQHCATELRNERARGLHLGRRVLVVVHLGKELQTLLQWLEQALHKCFHDRLCFKTQELVCLR